MAFDGDDHRSVHPVHRSLYHPYAPAAGAVCGHSLRSAFNYARWYGRPLWQFTMGWNHRSPAQNQRRNATLTEIERGTHIFPSTATHLVAFLRFRFPTTFQATASHRLILTDTVQDPPKANTDTGSTFTLESVGHRRNIGPRGFQLPRIEDNPDPFEHQPDVHTQVLEVAIANVTAGELCSSYIEGKALDSATAMPIEYHFIGVWHETRG